MDIYTEPDPKELIQNQPNPQQAATSDVIDQNPAEGTHGIVSELLGPGADSQGLDKPLIRL